MGRILFSNLNAFTADDHCDFHHVYVSVTFRQIQNQSVKKNSSIIDRKLHVATMQKIKNNNEETPLPSIQSIVSYDMKCHAGFNQGVV